MTASLLHWASTAPTWERAGAGVAAAVVTAAAFRVARNTVRALKRWDLADVITVLIALATTVYAGSGNWQFLARAMHYDTGLRAVLVCALEGAVVVEGLRSRKNITAIGKAGADGVGLWILAGLSSVLASSTSGSLQEALGRLAIPLVAAWLWERLLAPQRRARKELRESSPIRWRITGERIAVWLRLADAADTSVSAIESARKVVRFLKAGDRARRPRLLQWLTLSGLRADRARTRLAAHALLHHGDPTGVHTELAQRMLAEALRRLDDGPQDRDDRPAEGVDTPPADTPALIAEGHAMAINGGALTGLKPLPQAVGKPGRPSTEEAEQIIKFCWESGVGVRETARAASRDVGQVSRRFARLDERHGARARREESDEIPLVTVANGTPA